MQLEWLLLGLGALLLAELFFSHRRLRRAITPGPLPPSLLTYPAVTVIRPIRGLDAGARENIRAAFETGYPGEVRTLFVFDDGNEPALPLVLDEIRARQAAGEDPRAGVVLCGHPPPGRTGKLNAMIAGLKEATTDVVVFADSDIRPSRRALRTLVDTLYSSPGVGAAFTPVVVTEPPVTVGDVGYALLLNGLYGPAADAASRARRGELPFIMGQFMAFRRHSIDAMGGLETADGQLVDDMYLGRRLNEVGYKNMVARIPVPVIQRGLPLTDFFKIFTRWITFSRTGLPGWSFKVTPFLHALVYWVGLGGAVFAASQGLWLAAVLTGLAPFFVGASIAGLHRQLGGGRVPWYLWWVAGSLLLVAPVVMLRVQFQRSVTWRGRRYRLDPKGSIGAAGGAAATSEPITSARV